MVYNDTSETLDMAGRLVGYASGSRYQMRGDFLFQGIPLVDAHVLEIGCGSGAWAIWAALHGARRVIGIEPEAEGSTQGTLENMRRSVTALGLHGRVEARAEFLHDLPVPDDPYDLVIMYNVINHLDEESVVALHQDRDAYNRYVARLKDLRRRMRPGGWLIVADCGRDNFWPRLGMPSPFVPSIEWHKHQNPTLWIDLFREAGFLRVDLRWSPLQPFPRLTANRFVQYLTCSHFVLRLQAV
ncbi:MAG: Methyltransferase domain [Nitrospira sp.]|jgi:SAM-dependent methyltransferase|nr:Methyltransferase domain [Nitrospira sp.]